MLSRLRHIWLTLTTLLVVFVATWAGAAAGMSPRYDEDTIHAARAGGCSCEVLEQGGPSSMQEEDDEAHADELAVVPWHELELALAAWPEPLAQRSRRDLVGERPPYVGPLERPPHA